MSEVDQLDDAGRADTPITNEMANPPHCDRDKFVCPFARWSDAKIESDAKMIAALREALRIVRLYIADQMIAGAIIIPAGQYPSGNEPSLLQFIDAELGNNEQTVGESK